MGQRNRTTARSSSYRGRRHRQADTYTPSYTARTSSHSATLLDLCADDGARNLGGQTPLNWRRTKDTGAPCDCCQLAAAISHSRRRRLQLDCTLAGVAPDNGARLESDSLRAAGKALPNRQPGSACERAGPSGVRRCCSCIVTIELGGADVSPLRLSAGSRSLIAGGISIALLQFNIIAYAGDSGCSARLGGYVGP